MPLPFLRHGRPARRAALIAAAAAFAFAGSARAQSLQELYDAARGYDSVYLAARALSESAIYRVEQTYALKRLSVGATAGATYNWAKPAITDQTYTYSQSQAAVNAKYPLLNRVNSLTIDQAKKTLDVAQADLDAAEQDLIIRLSQAYFDVLAAQDTLEFTRTNKAAITEQLASAKRNFEVGTQTITDTREAQARYDLATAQEIAAQNDLQTRRAALDQLVGRSNVAPRPLAAPLELPALQPESIDPWLSSGDAQHPNVRRARAGLEIAEFDTARARAAGDPTVDLTATVAGTYTKSHSGDPNLIGGFPGRVPSASVGVQINMPLYTGGQIQNRIKETLSLEEKARDDVESARRGVALGTRQLYLSVISGRAQVQALEAAESSSKLALEATQLGYRVGVRVNVDVLNAQTQLFQTQRDLARARYDLLLARLRLRQAAGQLDATDVASLNALLAR